MMQRQQSGVLVQCQARMTSMVQYFRSAHGVHVLGRAARVVGTREPRMHGQRVVAVPEDVAVAQLVVVVRALLEGVDVGVGVGVDVAGVVKLHRLLRGVWRGKVGGLEVRGGGVRQARGRGKRCGIAGHQAKAAMEVRSAILFIHRRKKKSP